MIAKHAGDCIPHTFQDTRYGKGFRVMNPCRDGKHWRCTVCAPPKVASSRRGGTYTENEMVIRRR